MIRRAFQLIYGSHPVGFEFSGTPEVAVATLAPEVRGSWSIGFREALVGSVDVDRIKLHRRRPCQHNSFQPQFIGRFEFDGRTTRLVGKYRMDLYTRVFMTLWFGFIALWTLTVLVVLATTSPLAPVLFFMPIAGVLMFLVGVAIVLFGGGIGAKDEKYINRRLREILKAKRIREIGTQVDPTSELLSRHVEAGKAL